MLVWDDSLSGERCVGEERACIKIITVDGGQLCVCLLAGYCWLADHTLNSPGQIS